MDKEQEYKEDEEFKEDSLVVNEKNEIKMSQSKVEQAHIKQLLAKRIPIEVIQYIGSTVNTCEQKMV